MKNLLVIEKKGQPMATSRMIAEKFDKEHAEVIYAIEGRLDSVGKIKNHGLIEQIIEGGKSQVEKYFIESNYTSRGKKYKEYLLTRDGFSLLAMGFTGQKALQWKLKYIDAFNKMADYIQSIQTAKLEFPAFTRAIMLAHEEPKGYHYSNEIDMINKIVLGMKAKKFKQVNNIDDKVQSIRPYLTANQIKYIEELQRIDIGLLVAVKEYQQRQIILESYFKNRLLDLIA